MPEWMQEYPSEEDSPEESSQSARPILTPLEATAELTKFRPIILKPSDLKYLLECHAEPNMPLKTGDLSPLRKVIEFRKREPCYSNARFIAPALCKGR